MECKGMNMSVATKMVSGLVISLAMLAGCDTHYLNKQQEIDRANLPLTPIDITPTDRPAHSSYSTAGSGASISTVTKTWIDETSGTYQFTVPPTMSMLKEETNAGDQYRIYVGRPGAGDQPFVVITTGANQAADAASGANGLKVTKTRTYLLNGLAVNEWQGYTAEEKPFCELIGTHLGAGTQVHALAIGRTPELGKQALAILGSLHWVSSSGASAATQAAQDSGGVESEPAVRTAVPPVTSEVPGDYTPATPVK